MSQTYKTSIINDTRTITEFRGCTFSQFKKKSVIKELETALLNSRIEQSCYWCAELVCSGHLIDLWDCLFIYYGKHVHSSNLNISIYLMFRFETFKNIIRDEYLENELDIRNDERIRKLFSEIICILCEASVQYTITFVKIKPNEYDIPSISDKLKAPNLKYATQIMTSDDPLELYIAVNELAYCISYDADHLKSHMAFFWIEWIYGYENICKHQGNKKQGACRIFAPVALQRQNDIVWIIWDIFINEIKIRTTKHKLSNVLNMQKVLDAFLDMFCVQYNRVCFGRRKYILYIIASMLCDKNIDLTKSIVSKSQKENISCISKNINSIYKQIKNNENNKTTKQNNKNNDNENDNIKLSMAERTTGNKMNIISDFEEEFTPRIQL